MQQYLIVLCLLLLFYAPSNTSQYKGGLRSFIIKDLKKMRDIRLAYEMEEQKRHEAEMLEQAKNDEMRRRVIKQYLLPMAGQTSVLNDLYNRF